MLPESRIGWVTGPGPAPILSGQPSLDEVHVLPRKLGRATIATVSALRAGDWELAIDLHGILKSGLLSRRTGAPRRVAYAPPLGKEGSHLFATEVVPSPGERWRVAHFLGLVSSLGAGEVDGVPPVTIPILEEERERVRGWLEEVRDPARHLVVVHPGTSRRGAWRRWPPERYRRVAERLAATDHVDVVVSWGPGEEELVARVRDGSSQEIHAAPLLNLRELGELMRQATLYVGGDTGPMHLAGAVGTPVVAIFGASDAGRNRPLGRDHVILDHGEPLRRRPWNRERLKASFLAISAERVYDEAARKLGLF
jgi:ADP-heptose:LPS heptosyltransferase